VQLGVCVAEPTVVLVRGLVLAIGVFASRRADASEADPFEMAVELNVAVLRPSLADSRFTYQGQLRNGGAGSLNATGRDMGVVEPNLTLFTISAGPRFRYGTFRFVLDYGLGSGDVKPADPTTAFLTDAPATIGAVGIAVESGLSLREGSLLVELRGHVGARYYGVALPGFQEVLCRGAPPTKAGGSGGASQPCTASTWTEFTSLAPTIAVDYGSREGDVRPFVGVSFAWEMLGVEGYAAGISIGFHFGTPPGAPELRSKRRRYDLDPLVFPEGWDDIVPSD
jgi:hypothetical protein